MRKRNGAEFERVGETRLRDELNFRFGPFSRTEAPVRISLGARGGEIETNPRAAATPIRSTDPDHGRLDLGRSRRWRLRGYPWRVRDVVGRSLMRGIAAMTVSRIRSL
jgi:hypothetical protein